MKRSMHLHDRLTLDARKRTKEGYLAVRAKAARTGIYDYLASEVNAPADRFKPSDRVRIYRDADEVFSEEAVRSFIGRPITNDHPSVPVTANNWKQFAGGVNMGAMRDGDYLAFDLLLTDADLIADVDAGKRELSNGYATDIDWTPGHSPDGQAYDARQTTIRGNHVAVVDAGRAGPDCAIADGKGFAACDANAAAIAALKVLETKPMRTITLDGLTVNLGDEAAVEVAINKLQTTIADHEGTIATRDETISTLTGEKAALEAQLADEKAKTDPAKLDKLVADRADLVAKARAMVPNFQADGKTDADIRREVVTAKIGDTAKGLDDAGIKGAFMAMAKDVKIDDEGHTESIGAPPPATPQAGVVDTLRTLRYA